MFIFTNSYHLKEWQKKELEQIKQLKFISAAHNNLDSWLQSLTTAHLVNELQLKLWTEQLVAKQILADLKSVIVYQQGLLQYQC